MIKISSSGSTRKTQSFLNNLSAIDSHIRSALDAAGRRGVEVLSSATPVDSSITANSWTYEVDSSGGKHSISWINTNRQGGVNIAVILQYGHGTGTGGWVSGRDYINPAIRPIFDEIAEDVWKKVKSA